MSQTSLRAAEPALCAANQNTAMHVLSDGAHLRVAGGRIMLARVGGALALAIIDCDGRHMVQLTAEEAAFLAEQLTR